MERGDTSKSEKSKADCMRRWFLTLLKILRVCKKKG